MSEEDFYFRGLQRNHYGVILADPPTRFASYDKKTVVSARATVSSAEKLHYNTMSHSAIREMPVGDLAAENCVLVYWTSGTFLQIALENIEAWGFDYKTIAFCWTKCDPNIAPVKPAFGMGFWTRQNAEIALLATRGKPKRLDAGVPQTILEPRREHSRKPDCTHARIERLVSGPFCELFGRQSRPGWDVWGDEATRFDGENGSAGKISKNLHRQRTQSDGPLIHKSTRVTPCWRAIGL